MRAADWIQIVVSVYFAALAWICPLPARRRIKVTAIALLTLTTTGLCAFGLHGVLPPLAASVARDWIPATLVLLVYWQAGAFFMRVDQPFQNRLEYLDEHYTSRFLRWIANSHVGGAVSLYLECAYLLCYPMIPMCLGALYLLHLGRYADRFWTVVLISTYGSYAVLPFLQALPPRMLKEDWHVPLPHNPVRRFNLWILGRASIHANTFPSAHVAASISAALVLLQFAPWPVSVLFALIAIGITLGTFAGRYHYGADAVAGVAVAAVAFLVEHLIAGDPQK